MGKQILNWDDSSFNAAAEAARRNPLRRYIAVSDHTVCSLAILPAGMTVQSALADYAAGYDAGEAWSEDITVMWTLYERGGEMDDGRSAFTPR
jgi:hypothetical protein